MVKFIKKFFSRRKGKPGFIQPVILHDGEKTKRIAQLWHIKHNAPEHDGLALDLIKFDKAVGTEWLEELEPSKEIYLSEEEVRILYDYLSANLSAIGVRESGRYAIVPIEEEFGPIHPSQRSLVSKLITLFLKTQDKESFSELLKNLERSPEVIFQLRGLLQLQKYKSATQKLDELIIRGESEQDFKDWFRRNPWIFGTEYINRDEVSQIALRHRIDLCFTSPDGYQDVIELKTPSIDLLREDKNRPGNYYPSEELSKAIGQCSNYLYEIEEQRANIERTYNLPFLKPRARIIMGRSNNWDQGQHHTLRRLNAAFHNIDIMTYDHIMVRAKQMIKYYEGS